MSAPVDVLAVMDAFISTFRWAEECEDDSEFLRDANAARAAVAELIEAAAQVHDAWHDEEDWDRLSAAIDRVKGGAA